MHRLLLFGVLAVVQLAAAPAGARRFGRLAFGPCTLTTPGGAPALEAQCAQLEVPEDRAREGGRQITLAIAWVPARTEAAPDPVFFLAGGPGQGARAAFPAVAVGFHEVLRTRDVILIDQRGTGGSNPLSCPGEGAAVDDERSHDPAAPTDDSPEAAARLARACLRALSARADVRHYTTTDAVMDLEAARRAVGAERINLYGGSYGTRVAQQYAKTFPQHTRALVLDSAVPATLVLGSEHAQNLDAALAAHFTRCAADEACAGALPDAETALARVREQLASRERVPVAYRDPVTGEERKEVPTMAHLRLLLRLYSYAPLTAVLLPVVVQQALAGDYAPLLAQAHHMSQRLDAEIAQGMQLSVLCSEDADELVADPADAKTVMGTGFVASTQAQCGVWPRGRRPDDFRMPLQGDLAVLAISGELDPVTPPRYGAAAIAQLDNARHLVLPGQGHTPVNEGCMPKLFAQFLETTDARALDAACLERLAAFPPGSGLHGWEP